MKITDLIVTPVAIPLEVPLAHAWGVHPGFGRVIIQVITDEGLVGLGETTLTPNGRQMEEVLRSCKMLILGEDPFNLERLRWKVSNPFYVRMFGPNLTNAYAAIEFACLDIQGQAVGRPVCDLLGGQMRDRVPVSAYIFYETPPGGEERLPWEEADARIVEKCAELVEGKGCRAIKFKGGVYPPHLEAETVRHLRARFPDVPIRLDPNSSWALTTAVRIARELADCGLEYLEDPVWGLSAMAKLKRLARGCRWRPIWPASVTRTSPRRRSWTRWTWCWRTRTGTAGCGPLVPWPNSARPSGWIWACTPAPSSASLWRRCSTWPRRSPVSTTPPTSTTTI